MAKKGSKFNSYTAEFKVNLVKEYLNNQGSYMTLTKKYGLKSTKQLRDWVKLYNEKGEEVFLVNPRDKIAKPKSIKLEEMSLEEQVKYLKMENDILKKAKALLKG